ncbi:ogr/Delta-like zinc finger family protein [Pseudomonas saxonica]|uniref:Ogr/Delta-like zinc finger family protein n=1 Tax=Pseudomonas saxonica TaxID=2600598 RepID=A0ABY3GG95_9PSED|nr:ogr/Delta-like zinc finger family protein [Pseudomonas saxonica]TWR88720.1 ogr/Delta-like zinc finger family protein [Pseudomonas saxonica]
MRITCKECTGRARIGSRENMNAGYAKLYCQCLNPHCGHSFVMDLSYSHALRPSAAAVDQLIFDRLRTLPISCQQQLFDQLNSLPV